MARRKLFENSNHTKEETDSKEKIQGEEEEEENEEDKGSTFNEHHLVNSFLDKSSYQFKNFSEYPMIQSNAYQQFLSQEKEENFVQKFPLQYSCFSEISFGEYNQSPKNKKKMKSTGNLRKSYSTTELNEHKKNEKSQYLSREEMEEEKMIESQTIENQMIEDKLTVEEPEEAYDDKIEEHVLKKKLKNRKIKKDTINAIETSNDSDTQFLQKEMNKNQENKKNHEPKQKKREKKEMILNQGFTNNKKNHIILIKKNGENNVDPPLNNSQYSDESVKRIQNFKKGNVRFESENYMSSANERNDNHKEELNTHLRKIMKKNNQTKEGTLLSKIKNKERNNLYNNLKGTIDEEYEAGHIKNILFKLYMTSLEHKETNFLCLKEILKKVNVLLKKQVEINKVTASQQADRQKLFQQVYELKEQIADKAFNSIINKDVVQSYVKGNIQKEINDEFCDNYKIAYINTTKMKKKKRNKQNNSLDDFEYVHTNNKQIHMFIAYLNALENSVYSFTHFCRNIASQTYPDGKIGLNPLEQKVQT